MKGFIIAASIVFSLQIANSQTMPMIMTVHKEATVKKGIVLTSTNHCTLQSAVSPASMQVLSLCLADKAIIRRTRNYPIYLVVNSGGGEIYAGMRFIEFAKTIKNVDTVTIYAASMASAIVEALPGKRYGTSTAVTMFHRAKGTFRGQFEDGEVESRLKMWKTIVRTMEKTNSKRIGITLKDYKSKVVNEWYTFGEDNIKANILDEISVVKCSGKLLKNKRKKKVKGMFGDYEVTISACPLVN